MQSGADCTNRGKGPMGIIKTGVYSHGTKSNIELRGEIDG